MNGGGPPSGVGPSRPPLPPVGEGGRFGGDRQGVRPQSGGQLGPPLPPLGGGSSLPPLGGRGHQSVGPLVGNGLGSRRPVGPFLPPVGGGARPQVGPPILPPVVGGARPLGPSFPPVRGPTLPPIGVGTSVPTPLAIPVGNEGGQVGGRTLIPRPPVSSPGSNRPIPAS